VGTRWPTACNGSDLMTRAAERISAMMDFVIRVHEQVKRHSVIAHQLKRPAARRALALSLRGQLKANHCASAS
jgi:hypothetical protein